MTRTYAVLEVSADTYDEIQKALAGHHYRIDPYQRSGGQPLLEMDGIALARLDFDPATSCPRCMRIHYHRPGCPLAGDTEIRP